MTRTLLFVLVISFTLSARAKMSVSHINHGIPAHCGVDSIETNNTFFRTNNIPIIGYTKEHNNVNFTFNVRSCDRAFIKSAAYAPEYAFLNDSTLLIKLQINPSYTSSLADQASCYSKATVSVSKQQMLQVNIAQDIQKRFGKLVNLDSLTIIVASDYQDEHNLLDLTSLAKIEKFVGQGQ